MMTNATLAPIAGAHSLTLSLALALTVSVSRPACAQTSREPLPPWTVSASTGLIDTRVDLSTGELDSQTWTYGASLSRLVSEAWAVGVAVDGFTAETEAPDTPDTTANGVSGAVFATWVGEAWFVDGALSLGAETQDLAFRRLNGAFVVRGSDGLAYGLSLAAGYDALLGDWRVTPEAAVYYDTADFDGVTFENPVPFILGESQFDSVTAEIGVTAARRVGAVRPDVSVFLVSLNGDFEQGLGRRVTGSGDRTQFVTSEDAELWGELGAGLTLDLTDAARLRLSASTAIARDDVDTARISLSLSRDF